jgi:hypothetical protein
MPAHASYHLSIRGFHERYAPEDGDYVAHGTRPDREHLNESGKLDPRHALMQYRSASKRRSRLPISVSNCEQHMTVQ